VAPKMFQPWPLSDLDSSCMENSSSFAVAPAVYAPEVDTNKFVFEVTSSICAVC